MSVINNPTRSYTFNREKNTGYQPCDILVQLYGDPGFRALVVAKEDIEAGLRPWEICRLLNDAYAQGQKDAKEDIQTILGINT
jgi:hypothetical protein